MTAEQLNSHLERGGSVVIGTYTRATTYKPACAGMFAMRGGSLHVRRGNGWDCLSIGQRLLVSVKLIGGAA